MTDPAGPPETKPDAPTPAEIMKAREEAVSQATLDYTETLRVLGVDTYLLGVPLREGPEGSGAFRCVGRNDIILNLLAAMIRLLIPQDFDNLLTELMFGAYFEEQRNASKILRAAAVPPPGGKPN